MTVSSEDKISLIQALTRCYQILSHSSLNYEIVVKSS
jgi:hypothetical protein